MRSEDVWSNFQTLPNDTSERRDHVFRCRFSLHAENRSLEGRFVKTRGPLERPVRTPERPVALCDGAGYVENVTSAPRLRWPHRRPQTARRPWLAGTESLA